MTEPAAPATASIPVTGLARFGVRRRLVRVRDSLPAIAQIVLAVLVAYLFCTLVLGHSAPLLAITVTVSSLGLVRDARPGRVLETLLGMLTGVLVAELLRLWFGQGAWQLAVALAFAMLTARAIAKPPAFATAAAIQAGIVMVIPGEAPFSRLTDAVVAAVTALAITALVPRTARGVETRDGLRLFEATEAALTTLVQALRRGDRMRAERGLEKARALQSPVDAWRTSLDSARAIARISPFLARQRTDLERHARTLAAMDLAVRNLRVVARRALYLVDAGFLHPVTADLLAEIGGGLGGIARALHEPEQLADARMTLRAVAERLDPTVVVAGAGMGEQNLIAALRPLVVDLLVAAGEEPDAARAALPRI